MKRTNETTVADNFAQSKSSKIRYYSKGYADALAIVRDDHATQSDVDQYLKGFSEAIKWMDNEVTTKAAITRRLTHKY